MNKKGFTLIELLGIIVILSIIMLIAIPNVTSTLERSKKDTYLADAKKMVSLAQYEIRKSNVSKPTTEGAYVKVTLQELATDNIIKDPDGYNYDTDKSYVVIALKNGYLEYYVQLVVNTDPEGANFRGIILTNVENLTGDQRYKKYKTNVSTLPTNIQATINQLEG